MSLHALRSMNPVQHVDGFQFDQHSILDQQIGHVGADDHAVIMHRDIVLLLDIQTRFS